jgi:hypothetical protein
MVFNLVPFLRARVLLKRTEHVNIKGVYSLFFLVYLSTSLKLPALEAGCWSQVQDAQNGTSGTNDICCCLLLCDCYRHRYLCCLIPFALALFVSPRCNGKIIIQFIKMKQVDRSQSLDWSGTSDGQALDTRCASLKDWKIKPLNLQLSGLDRHKRYSLDTLHL